MANPTDLLISEYIEGSSNDKAIELFNGTGAAIDLSASNYVLQIYSNANTTAGLTIALTGVIPAGGVFVVAPTNAANATIVAEADQTNGTAWFNGNDSVVLRKGGAAGSVIDSIGQIAGNPSAEWGSGLTSTENNTLVLKSDVSTGDTNPNDAYDPSVRYEGYAQNDVSHLGSHTFSGGGGGATVSINDVTIAEGDAGTKTLQFTVTRTDAATAFSVSYTTANGTATAGSDYQATSGTLTFTAGGPLTQTVSVTINGDTTTEANETFAVNLSNLVNTTGTTTISDASGVGTISNDDVGITKIYDVQGAGHRSSMAGQSVTVEGIVTAIDSVGRENDSNNPVGYYIQEAVGDGNVNTSDAVFVFLGTGSGISIPAGIEIGAKVRVTATVNEFQSGQQLSVTQLNPTGAATVLSTGNALPEAVHIGVGGRLPPLVSLGDDDGDANGTGVFDPATQGSDFWETLEGMRVTLDDVRSVSPFRSNFDEQFVTPNVGADPSTNPRGGLTISDTTPATVQPASKVFDFNPERIQLDDEAGVNLPSTVWQVGDKLGDVTGVVNYANGQYEVNITEALDPASYVPSNNVREVTTINENFDRIRVATFNVENLAPVGQPVDGVATPASKFSGLAAAIVSNLKAPEIIGLQEVLDNDGETNTSVVSAATTLSQLIDAIVAAGGPRYVAIDSLPVDDTVGGIGGGNQRVAYLFNPEAVSPTIRNNLAAVLSDANGVKVYQAPTANQIGQGDSDFNATRKSLPMEWAPTGFTDDHGGSFWTVNNHLSSKGGSQPLYGTNLDLPLYTDPLNGAAQSTGSNEREGQAEAINAYVDGILGNASATDNHVVVLGDLNDFQFFPVVDLITGQLVRTTANPDGTPSVFAAGDPVLSKLIEKLPVEERYSYNFDGNAQALDHILVSKDLYASGNFDIVHINSEFSEQLSDHDPSVSSLLFARYTAIATDGDEVLDQAAYTAKFGTVRGSLAGDDIIDGMGGDDTINAGAGNDTVFGGIGDDRITDTAGDDTIDGQGNDDTIDAGIGNDSVTGGGGNDRLEGGEGTDTVVYRGAITDFTVKLIGTGKYQIIDKGGDAFAEGTDVVTGFENFNFGGIVYSKADLTPYLQYTLQILHLSDGEAGLLAPKTAPNLAALVDAFDGQYDNTLILSGGDNFIPGPFGAAGTDPSLTAVLGGTTAFFRPDIAIHNKIGVEVSAIGNHEWDLGSNVFNDALLAAGNFPGAQFALVTSNLDFSADTAIKGRADNSLGGTAGNLAGSEASTIQGKIVPWTTVTEGGQKIGILGATTQILERISSPSGTEVNGFPKAGQPGDGQVEVDDMDLLASQLQPIIDQMIASGLNKIVLQAHLQDIANERLLATKLNGVDIILSAGSNTRLGDANDQAVEFPGHAADFADTYPIVVNDAQNGETTLIINTDNEYTYLGRLVVDFDAQGRIIVENLDSAINGAYAATEENVAKAWNDLDGDLSDTAFAEGTKGEEVADITEAVNAVLLAKDGTVHGYTDVYLEGERVQVRGQETNLGDLTADANAGAARTALQGEDADVPFMVSLKNGGGIRAQIGAISSAGGASDKLPPVANPEAGKPEGGISQLDIENALRFNNGLMVFDTTPTGLYNILDYAAGRPNNNGGFPQIGGIRYSYDEGAASGSRLKSVALVDENGEYVTIVKDGVIVPDAPSLIRVVTLNFTANGGDGYPVKANGENFRYLLSDGTLSAPIDEALDFVTNAPSNLLGEQKALIDYLAANHGTPETAYAQEDTEEALDQRIQNLDLRSDTVLANQGPEIAGDRMMTVFKGQATVVTTADLTENDPDHSGANLTYSVDQAMHGQILVDGVAATSFTQRQLELGLVSFQHDGGQEAGTFTVTLRDAVGAESEAATVTVDVTAGENTAPSAVADIGAATEGQTLEANVLTNDTDPDAGQTLMVIGVAGENGAGTLGEELAGRYGKLTLQTDGSYSYAAENTTLPEGQKGTDTFTYTVSDGHGGTAEASITIEVTGGNPPFGNNPGQVRGTIPTSFDSVGTGDFDGNGSLDFLWRDTTTNGVTLWTTSTAGAVTSKSLGNVPANWTFEAVGDLNGNGTDDVILRNTTTGDTGAWIMRNGAPADWRSLGNLAADWQVKGTGDFDRNGSDDVLLFNTTTRAVDVFLQNSGGAGAHKTIGTVAAGWDVAGVGDLDGNGSDDVLLFNATTRHIGAWKVNDGQVGDWYDYGTLKADWAVTEIGNFNGKGAEDIGFYNAATGADGAWLINQGKVADWLAEPTHDNLDPIGVGRLNSTTDQILWHNTSTGAVVTF